MEHTRTLRSVLCEKLADSIEEHGLAAFGRRLLWFFAAGLVSSLMMNVELTLARLNALLGVNRYAPVRFALVFALVLAAPQILARCRSLLAAWSAASPEADTIEGIPHAELLDHLVTVGTFKRDEVKTKFGVPQFRVERLTKKMKEIGLLRPGENGMSVLNPDFTRQDLAAIFQGKTTAAELTTLFRKDGERNYTTRPSAAEIRERADSPPPELSPSPFTSQTLAAASQEANVPRLREAYAATCAA